MSNRNSVLTQLWQFAEAEATATGTAFSHVLDPIGLILFRPLKREGYHSTPINSLAFATTGGDGVHYSLLATQGVVNDQSPVVMTVPMNFGKENMVVGGEIHDFLSLGCQVGYFFLEQLTYDFRGTLYWLEHPHEWFDEVGRDPTLLAAAERKKELLRSLRRDLRLKPWERIPERLEYLQAKYLPMLEFAQDRTGAA